MGTHIGNDSEGAQLDMGPRTEFIFFSLFSHVHALISGFMVLALICAGTFSDCVVRPARV
jgi:hypothetical protein